MEDDRPAPATGIDAASAKADLHRYLRTGREVLLWKLDGLSSYDMRRPLVATGTNLLGLVKHLTMVEAGYFGATFGRPLPDGPAWTTGRDDPMADMWARPEESAAELVDRYRRVSAHADATISDLTLDATGTVPWWSAEANPVTLHRILVHVATETHRHAGHADILRELIDGVVGYTAPGDNLPDADAQWWADHRDRVEQAARGAAEG